MGTSYARAGPKPEHSVGVTVLHPGPAWYYLRSPFRHRLFTVV
ncbi:MAG TPA: hypothetical protein VIK54_06080 [Acidimicrobiia bacterium]